MACCRQATSYYLSQCWAKYMSPYGVTRPQCVVISCSSWTSHNTTQIVDVTNMHRHYVCVLSRWRLHQWNRNATSAFPDWIITYISRNFHQISVQEQIEYKSIIVMIVFTFSRNDLAIFLKSHIRYNDTLSFWSICEFYNKIEAIVCIYSSAYITCVRLGWCHKHNLKLHVTIAYWWDKIYALEKHVHKPNFQLHGWKYARSMGN